MRPARCTGRDTFVGIDEVVLDDDGPAIQRGKLLGLALAVAQGRTISARQERRDETWDADNMAG